MKNYFEIYAMTTKVSKTLQKVFLKLNNIITEYNL